MHKNNRRRAQIAVILTLVMAVIFLFVAVTINIGHIAQEKTTISNAADGGALLLASSLGSLGNMLRIKLDLYHGKSQNCEVNWALVVSAVAVVLALIVTIATLGAGTPILIGSLAATLVSVGAFGFGMWNVLIAEPGVFKQIELKFQKMSIEQRIKEKAIQYALFAIVTDPNKICADGSCADPQEHGGCVDPTDLDMDGQTSGDCIHCLSRWYNARLNTLIRSSVGDIVVHLYELLFNRDNPLIYVWEDPETWQAREINNRPEYGFWIDVNGMGGVEPRQGDTTDERQGSLRLEVLSADTHKPRGIIYGSGESEHDIYFTDWLTERFVPLVQDLYRFGYGFPNFGGFAGYPDFINNNVNTAVYNIGKLWASIKEFEKEASKLYGTPMDSQVQSFDDWIKLFYNEENNREHWYKRMEREWLPLVNGWLRILTSHTEQINRNLDKCKGRGPYICGPGGGECCGWDPVDPETGLGGGCNRNCGCLSLEDGGGMSGGRLCPSPHDCSKPQERVDTPTGGSRPCCDSVYNLHYQLCDATVQTDETCQDTYHNCDVDHLLNRITWEHAIQYLTKFKEDVEKIMSAFQEAYNSEKAAKDDPRFYEALYEWDDRIAKGEPGNQIVHHIVYVKLGDFTSYTNGQQDQKYAIPYPHRFGEAELRETLLCPPCFTIIPKKCATVASERGSFTITVARYDQDVGTATSSPFKNLWIFKTRKNPKADEQEYGKSGFTSADAMPSNYSGKAQFVLNNGIVSQTLANYGPGETYTKDEMKDWKTSAQMRNRHISIRRLR